MTIEFQTWACADKPEFVYRQDAFRCLASSALSAAARFAEWVYPTCGVRPPADWCVAVWCYNGEGEPVEVEVELAKKPVFVTRLARKGGAG